MNKDMKILVVDDFSTMRRIIKNLLGELGFSNIVEADDGSTAYPILEDGGVDLLITDWNMPNMPGIELLHKVRASDRLRNVPVMMVTAEATREQIVQAAEAGVDGYIIKPFTAQTLGDKIRTIFERTEATY
jgi:two-component system chemotaxis response regulator CheY